MSFENSRKRVTHPDRSRDELQSTLGRRREAIGERTARFRYCGLLAGFVAVFEDAGNLFLSRDLEDADPDLEGVFEVLPPEADPDPAALFFVAEDDFFLLLDAFALAGSAVAATGR